MTTPSEVLWVTDAPTTRVARWEWRVFLGTSTMPPRLQSYVTAIAGPARPETYILSAASPNSVKIRADRLEIKRLERVDDRGLELWRPVINAHFPVDTTVIHEACDAWGVPMPFIASRNCSMGSLLANVVAPNDHLTIATLTKRRTPLRALDCAGEYAEVMINGETWVSVAFEDANPDRVMAVVLHLGFDSHGNNSHPAALKRMVRFHTPALD